MWAALTVFFPLSRYKLPAAAVAAVAVAAGLAEALAFRVAWRRAAVAALVVAAAARASVVRFRPTSHENGVRNVAFAFADEGDRPHAMEFLRRYLADDPDDGPALERLGRLTVDDGRPDEGLAMLRRAAQDGRSRWTASAGAVHALVVLGRADAAELEGVPLLESPPGPTALADLLADLAVAADARGDASTAAERLRAAEAADADSPAVARARKLLAR
jgi:tetratricopeptide (TPR) repeat protein